jgi:hypothetical protein
MNLAVRACDRLNEGYQYADKATQESDTGTIKTPAVSLRYKPISNEKVFIRAQATDRQTDYQARRAYGHAQNKRGVYAQVINVVHIRSSGDARH